MPMLFMVIERSRNRDPKPIYRRLRDQGRQMPDGLKYLDSWIEPSFERCFQRMECDDARLLRAIGRPLERCDGVRNRASLRPSPPRNRHAGLAARGATYIAAAYPATAW